MKNQLEMILLKDDNFYNCYFLSYKFYSFIILGIYYDKYCLIWCNSSWEEAFLSLFCIYHYVKF